MKNCLVFEEYFSKISMTAVPPILAFDTLIHINTSTVS